MVLSLYKKKVMYDSIFPSLGNDIIMADMIFAMHHSTSLEAKLEWYIHVYIPVYSWKLLHIQIDILAIQFHLS